MSQHGRPGPAPNTFVAVFIKRPILALVVSLLIVIAGAAALLGVEVRELPEVDRPVVSVRTIYPGSTPETIDAEVTAVIESAVAQIDGVTSISSSSSFETSSVVAEFSVDTNIDLAATDVKNAVSAIQRRLPQGVEEPTVAKAEADGAQIMRIIASAPGLSEGELGDLIERMVEPRLQAVEGVAAVERNGVRNQVIRVRLSPTALNARGLAISDVARVVAAANISAPSGSLRSGNQEILIRAHAPAVTPEQIGALRLNPQTLLSDVATVEWGVDRDNTLARYNNAPAAGLSIVRQAQSNTVAVADGVRAALEELKASLPGITLTVTTDDSVYIKRAIEEVTISLGLSVIIVVVVIFGFLRSPRATIIPAIAIPVSLLGAVAALWAAGFSINILTLLALLMATGLVVDDAIVVTENIQRWRSMGHGPRAAALLGTREIVFAVIATTATLAAVFVPISFMPGQAGRLFSEFGFVLAASVLVSSFVGLTLCPMLTVKFAGRAARDNGAVADAPRPPGGALARAYGKALGPLIKTPWMAFAAASVFAVGAGLILATIPRELTPTEDRGRIFASATVQQSASFDYLKEKVEDIERILKPIVESGEGTGMMSIVGLGNSTRAFVMVRLEEWSKRKRSQQEIEAQVRPLIASIPGVNVQFRTSNSLGIRGGGQGLQFAVAADDYDQAADVAEAIAARLEQNPMFSRVALNFQPTQPQLNIKIDRDAAARLGVDAPAITMLVNAMADEFKAGEVFVGDKAVDIMLSAGGEPVDDPGDLANLFVRTGDGRFIPLSLVASVEETAVAANLSREQRRRAVPVTASLADGAELSDAIKELRAVAGEMLPGGMSLLLLGEARLLDQASQSAFIVLFFAALIVFLVLSAQFESFISALIIMSTAPFGFAAAIYAMQFTGGSLNYYSQIGLVLLIGVMAKNGILIVEFANQLRDRGFAVKDAVKQAAITRLRPVLMTALSTVLGGLPLILGSGAGAEARAALGWVVVGGLGFATLFTLFLTPAAYVIFARFARPAAHEAEAVARELAESARIRPQSQPAE